MYLNSTKYMLSTSLKVSSSFKSVAQSGNVMIKVNVVDLPRSKKVIQQGRTLAPKLFFFAKGLHKIWMLHYWGIQIGIVLILYGRILVPRSYTLLFFYKQGGKTCGFSRRKPFYCTLLPWQPRILLSHVNVCFSCIHSSDNLRIYFEKEEPGAKV